MHARRQIRAAIVQRLSAAPGLMALFGARTKPAGEEQLPFANVLTAAESAEDLADQWLELRTLHVAIHLAVRQAEGVADALDDLAEQVEILLGADQTLGGVCEFFRYQGCEPDYDSAAHLEAAALVLNYECKYVWAPSPPVDAWHTAGVQFDMAGPRNDPQFPTHPDGQIDAAATITLAQ